MILCNESGHVFIWAGGPGRIPDGWPCTCGMTRYQRDAEQRVHPASGGGQVDPQDKSENDRPSGAWECQECAWLVSGNFTNCPNCDEPRPS